MVKKAENEIFDGVKEEGVEEAVEQEKPKQKVKKPKRTMGEAEKTELIERLKAGRMKKRLAREANLQKEVKAVKKEIDESKNNNDSSSSLAELKKELQEMKQMIKESRVKLESPKPVAPQSQPKPVPKPVAQPQPKPIVQEVAQPQPVIQPAPIVKKKKWR